MKLSNILLGVAAVTTMTACTSEELSSLDKTPEIATGISDTQIYLASGQAKSEGGRSSIESADNGCYDAKGLGVFMLAKAETAPEGLTIDWSKDHTVVLDGRTVADNWSVPFVMPGTSDESRLFNVKADAVTFKSSTGQPMYTEIHWSDVLARYYPMGNHHSYSFYAYYPYTENITRTSDVLTATITDLDGTQDVLAGSAVSYNELAYNAKFYRDHENLNEDGTQKAPVVSMQHAMSRLQFFIVPGAVNVTDEFGVPTLSYEKALRTKVTKISIVNAPKTVDVVVADRNDKNNVGKTYINDDRETEYLLYDANDTPFAPKSLSMKFDNPSEPETIKVGQGILVPPLTLADEPYKLDMEVEYDHDGNPATPSQKVPLLVPMSIKMANDMLAGVSYNIVLTIYAPEMINLKTTLAPWKETSGADVFVTEDGTIIID